MKKEILIWQIIIFILGLILVLSIREYLTDKNEIEAEIGRANCVIGMLEVSPEESSRFCVDIKDYKIKSRRWNTFLE